MPKPKNVFGLFIGIDEYPAPVSRLRGTKKDVKRLKKYLGEFDQVRLHPLVLLDEAATKENIVNGVLNHLGKAGPEDVALFYFSGHGTQEKAHEAFDREVLEGKLEGIICYDSVTENEEKHQLLADKELYYLFYKIAQKKPHLLSIFDSCHSGSGLRSEFLKKQYLNRRSETYVFPDRNWEEFIFSNELKAEDLEQQSFFSRFTIPQQLHLAATQPDKVALELLDGGAFTNNLLKVLERTEGKVTYYDLMSMTRNFMKNEIQQFPQLESNGVDTKAKFKFFLDLEQAKGSPLYGNILYKADLGKWIIDLGHMNGMSRQAESVKIILSASSFRANIQSVQAEFSVLEDLGGELTGKENQVFKGFVDHFLSAPIKVFIHNPQELKNAETWIVNLIQASGKNVNLAQRDYQADYAVVIKPEGFIITYPQDYNRPLVQFSSPLSQKSANSVWDQIRHISQWEYVKLLHNPNSFLFKDHPIALEIEKEVNGEVVTIPIINDEIEMNYERNKDGSLGGQFYLKLTNQFNRRLFVSLLYLSINFQVYGRLLEDGVVPLNPGEHIYLWRRENPVELDLEEQVLKDNWKNSFIYFKLIASTEYFDISILEQDALPGPYEPKTRAGRAETRPESNPNANDWITRLITIKTPNPYFDPRKEI